MNLHRKAYVRREIRHACGNFPRLSHSVAPGKHAAMETRNQPVTFIGREYARGKRRLFGIKERDRLSSLFMQCRAHWGR